MPKDADQPTDVRAALTALGCADMKAAVWEQIEEAEHTWSLDVDAGVEVNWEALKVVREALRSVGSDELWATLQDPCGELSGLRALLCILASTTEPEAMCAYLDVLAIPGATGAGAFRPALFRHTLGLLRTLRKPEGEEEIDLDALPVLDAVSRAVRLVSLPDEAFA